MLSNNRTKGIALFDCKIVCDLAKAVRAQGLHFGVSSHRVEHDFFMGVGRKIPSDVNPYREHLIRFAEDQHTVRTPRPHAM